MKRSLFVALFVVMLFPAAPLAPRPGRLCLFAGEPHRHPRSRRFGGCGLRLSPHAHEGAAEEHEVTHSLLP